MSVNPKRLSYRQLAKEAGVSFKTLYRVLNNEPSVRPTTRKKVIRVLNLNGCNDGRLPQNRNIVISSGEGSYLRFWAEKFIEQLSGYPYHLDLIPFSGNHAKFLIAVENATAVVIFGAITEALYKEIRWRNPDAQLINIAGNSGDVLINVNHFDQGMMAAEYLYQKGHRNIRIITSPELYRQAAICRVYGCAAVFQYKYDLNVDRISLDDLEQFQKVSDDNRPSAFYASNSWLAEEAVRRLRRQNLQYPADYSILSTGLQGDSPCAVTDLDCIYHKPEELAELAEYFLIKRILTGTIKHITTHVDNYLHIAGSVSDRNQMEE